MCSRVNVTLGLKGGRARPLADPMGARSSVGGSAGLRPVSMAVGERAVVARSAARELTVLARRLGTERRRLEVRWLSACASCPELAEEDPGYPAALTRTIGPLFEALAAERVELAEIHALELCHELRGLGLGPSQTLLVVECLHTAVAASWNGAAREGSLRAGNDELRRLLTRVAAEVAAAPRAPWSLAESGKRERPRGPDGVEARGLVGRSERATLLRRDLAELADAPGSVLIVGESGTGKELAAQSLHALSRRRDRPFLAVNCAALPRELIESELFGHERGAFTGSRDAAPGLLRAAGDGTVFLDEVAEMPPELQPKLLRALEQRAVRPVGGLREAPFQARVVAATNREPEQALRTGQLRADLFYRFCAHRLEVPPLRERAEDIPQLVEHFLRELSARGYPVPSGFTPASLALLLEHDWPGNVRELRNVVEHCCAKARGVDVRPEHLPSSLRQGVRAPLSSGTYRCAAPLTHEPAGQLRSLVEVEREHIARALAAANGNKASAARLLGISRHQLYVRLERLGLVVGDRAGLGRGSG